MVLWWCSGGRLREKNKRKMGVGFVVCCLGREREREDQTEEVEERGVWLRVIKGEEEGN